MSKRPATTRSEGAAPAATRHLNDDQKKSLDLSAEAEHTDGPQREKMTRAIEKLGRSAKQSPK
jgi:hypothetical protein